MRSRVWQGRTATELFNMKTYSHDLESLYRRMWTRHEQGEVDHLTDGS